MKKGIFHAIQLLALVYLFIVLTGCALQRQIVWPMSAEEPVDRPTPPKAELVWIENEDHSRVEGWLFRPQTESAAPSPAVIFFHGNNEVMFWRYGVPGFIARDKYRTEDSLKRLSVPTLVMHGTRDNIIPIGDGRELGSLGPHTTYQEWDANHDLPTDWQPFETRLMQFLHQHLPPPS